MLAIIVGGHRDGVGAGTPASVGRTCPVSANGNIDDHLEENFIRQLQTAIENKWDVLL